MKSRNVIFDLDGTLLDTTEGVLESVRYTVQKLGYAQRSEKEFLKFIGPPIQQSFMTHYGADQAQAQEAADVFREYYKTEALLKAVPYDGIYQLCEQLQDMGIRMAVATYKREDYALALLKHFHFDTYFDPMHGADNQNVLKKEDIVRLCIDEMGAGKASTVLVGDTSGDALAAEKAGIPFIAVTYGFGFRDAADAGKYRNIGVAGKPLQILEYLLDRQGAEDR